MSNSFPRTNCELLGPANVHAVHGQISEHIFAPNGARGYCVYYPSNLFASSAGGIFSDMAGLQYHEMKNKYHNHSMN